MANNYLQPVNNHFGLENDIVDDVDDDVFLRNSRLNGSSSLNIGPSWSQNTNPFLNEQQQYYEDKRKEVEERTLNSTSRSLGLLIETEDVGKATAIELLKQREQLEKSSRQLDEINSTLRFSQRHLNGLKSVFGGLKNYISGNRDVSPRMTPPIASGEKSKSSSPPLPRNSAMPSEERNDNYLMDRQRNGISSNNLNHQRQIQDIRQNNPFESRLEENLEEMCGSLARLKGLATDMRSEIESQNDLIDNMQYKFEDVDIKISKQNKEMNKLLGKK